MSAKTNFSQAPRGLDLAPSDEIRAEVEAEVEFWSEGPDRPPARHERRAYGIFQFGLQGVLILAVATLVVAPFLFVPSWAAKAWPIFKTILVMDVIAYLTVAGGLLPFVEWGMRSAHDAS